MAPELETRAEPESTATLPAAATVALVPATGEPVKATVEGVSTAIEMLIPVTPALQQELPAVTMAESVDHVTKPEPAAPPPRAVAAVRGITPQQPAPVAREEPVAAPPPPTPAAARAPVQETSIISKLFGWFRSAPVEAARASAPEPAAPAAPSHARHEAPREDPRPREGRGRDRDRGARPHPEG